MQCIWVYFVDDADCKFLFSSIFLRFKKNALTLYLPKKSNKDNDSDKIQNFIIYSFFLLLSQKSIWTQLNLLLVLKLSKSDILNDLEVTQTIFIIRVHIYRLEYNIHVDFFCRILITDKLNQHGFQRKNLRISFILLNELHLNPCGIFEKWIV